MLDDEPEKDLKLTQQANLSNLRYNLKRQHMKNLLKEKKIKFINKEAQFEEFCAYKKIKDEKYNMEMT